MERVAITGHMSGLGKKLYELIPNSIGFDIAQNNDIRKPDQWLHHALECDVFINNAYDEFHQVHLLKKVFNAWINEDKTIVNISSISSDIHWQGDPRLEFYPTHKKALDDAWLRLQHVEKKCRVVNIKLGWMDTPMSKPIKTTANKLDVSVVAQDILCCIKNKNITSITLNAN